MKKIRTDKPEEMNAKLNGLNKDDFVFLYFFGTEDSVTKLSWCPDCVKSDLLIRNKLELIPSAVLIECPVGTREQWKGNPAHSYKIDSLFKVTRIPTVIRLKAGQVVRKLVEDECTDSEKLNQLCL